jgi:hypothetical protein
MEVASTLAHYNMSTIKAVKRFIGQVPDYKYFLSSKSEIAVLEQMNGTERNRMIKIRGTRLFLKSLVKTLFVFENLVKTLFVFEKSR